jgi:hypothetical protein
MKKLTFTFLLLSVFAGAFAQYKKASFFEKEGRTYGLSARLHALGDGKGSPVGFYAAFGRDQGGKRLFTWWELGFIPSYSFSKMVVDRDNNLDVLVTGKAKSQFIYGYNWGWHFIKSEGELPKLQPYLTAGFNFVILGGLKQLDDYSSYNTDPTVADRSFSVGVGGGAGLIFNINSWFALQATAGYTLQGNLAIESEDADKYYHMYTKHPYVSAGVRFRVSQD